MTAWENSKEFLVEVLLTEIYSMRWLLLYFLYFFFCTILRFTLIAFHITDRSTHTQSNNPRIHGMTCITRNRYEITTTCLHLFIHTSTLWSTKPKHFVGYMAVQSSTISRNAGKLKKKVIFGHFTLYFSIEMS